MSMVVMTDAHVERLTTAPGSKLRAHSHRDHVPRSSLDAGTVVGSPPPDDCPLQGRPVGARPVAAGGAEGLAR